METPISTRKISPNRANLCRIIRFRPGLCLVCAWCALGAIALTRCWSSPPQLFKSHLPLAQADLEVLREELNRYAASNSGNYPERLESIIENNPANMVWLDNHGQLPRDPWGNPYFYVVTDERRSFQLICFGSDGAPGGTRRAQDLRVGP